MWGTTSLCRKVGDLEASRWPEMCDPALEGKHLETPLLQEALLGYLCPTRQGSHFPQGWCIDRQGPLHHPGWPAACTMQPNPAPSGQF